MLYFHADLAILPTTPRQHSIGSTIDFILDRTSFSDRDREIIVAKLLGVKSSNSDGSYTIAVGIG